MCKALGSLPNKNKKKMIKVTIPSADEDIEQLNFHTAG
jgi:hypothetical protein